jgi:hypothetical protein
MFRFDTIQAKGSALSQKAVAFQHKMLHFNTVPRGEKIHA